MLAGFETRMSSTFSTSPTPKKLAQTRLVIERAKYGFSGAVSHLARLTRRSAGSSKASGRPSSGVGGCGLPVRG